jgi:DNA recombination protein RmuC
MTTVEILILAGLLLVAALQALLLLRARRGDDSRHFERVERELRQEMQASAQATRQDSHQAAAVPASR